jgi:hypothetical protein
MEQPQGDQEYVFSESVLKSMKRRNIDCEEVKEAIACPFSEEEDGKGNFCCQAALGRDRTLRVQYRVIGTQMHVLHADRAEDYGL